MSTITCAWCADVYDGARLSCPRCGAAAASAPVSDAAGWVEAPAVPDMAKLQLGSSRAQIEGTTVPVVDVQLAEGDSVYCTHDKLLWHDGTAEIATKKLSNPFKQMRSGMSLLMLEVSGPGRAAFSDNAPGELVPIPLAPGQRLRSREHHLLLATGTVAYDGKSTNAWYDTWEEPEKDEDSGRVTQYKSQRHHPYGMFRNVFQAADDTPGLVILHGVGNVYRRRLAEGETIDLAPHALLAWSGKSKAQMVLADNGWHHKSREIQPPSEHFYLSVRVAGPGEVWIQSGNHGETEGWDSIVDWSGIREPLQLVNH